MKSKVPFHAIMRITREGFEANLRDEDLAKALRATIEPNDLVAELIDASAPLSGGPLSRSKLTFEDWDVWRLSLNAPGEPGRGTIWRIPVSRLADGSWRSLLKKVSGRQPTVARPTRRLLGSGCAALMRREHASIEVRSSSGSRIIFDPIFRSRLLGCQHAMPVPEPGIAAAFVTHSHGDHYDIATLDYLASLGATVYVPEVPRHSLLSEDMHRALQVCGLASRICKWGAVAQIGDITVEAIPFFGEQASALVQPSEADVRNWGNCYRIDTADFSVLLLSDTGADPTGSMLDAISESVRRRGKIDVVVGSLRHLYMPFEVEGLHSNYVVLPMAGLRSDHDFWRRGRLPSSTLGISGTAAACAEAGARVFLPYAHGMTGYGQPVEANPFGPGPGLDETAACQALSVELQRIGCHTVVTRWNPGDSWTQVSEWA
jgi:L-ascorbate metabolism protein UlaG (beta-lactamase superfamily)